MRKRGNLREREQDSALLSMVVHTCNPDSLETEEGGLWVRVDPIINTGQKQGKK